LLGDELRMDYGIKDELTLILQTEGSKHFLESILNQIKTDGQLIRFLSRYTLFNGDFAGGVAHLAGAFHTRTDLFRDNSGVEELSDKASAIASYIFFAAVDEYATRDTGVRVTHRIMAQQLLAETLGYFSVASSDLQHNYPLNQETRDAIQKVRNGYGINLKNTDQRILHGLGFHLGSEFLADEEFTLLDRFLRKNYSGFVEHLQAVQMDYGKNAYEWIALHTIVEQEHFDNAITAATLTLDFYQGKMVKEKVREQIIAGFQSFAKVQKRFFENILQE